MATDDNFGETNLGWGDYGPWVYRKLTESELTSALTREANPKTIAGVDCITFQPAPGGAQLNQDRYAVEDWELGDGVWKFDALFDGHAGHATANHVVSTLPGLVKSALATAVQSPITPSSISNVLSSTIAAYDDGLTQDLFSIFPGGVDEISKLPNGEIDRIVNGDAANSAKVARCMQGSTVLISLLDPSKENVWVASLGDCQAALGVNTATSTWDISILSADHNAHDESEIQRIKSEHPGEEECLLRNRVLGGIAVTRAVGDHLFKLDQAWTTRVFLNTKPGFEFRASKPEDLIPRIRTPPYLSNKPDVQHTHLEPTEGSFLILCSDGLVDLCHARKHSELQQVSLDWIKSASSEESQLYGNDGIYGNRALRVLRKALGGQETDKVSAWLTVEMEESKWTDDITILVVPL